MTECNPQAEHEAEKAAHEEQQKQREPAEAESTSLRAEIAALNELVDVLERRVYYINSFIP